MHKAGSTIMDQILLDFAKQKGYKLDRISLMVPQSPLSEREVFLNYQNSMDFDGIYYGVARGPYVSEMESIGKLKTITQVRDPRDCITSAYFSFKISHTPPQDPEKRKAFIERRRNLENMDIDQYALSQVGGYKTRMAILRSILERHDDAILLKYEDMVLNTKKWLSQISDFIDQPINEELLETLGDKIDFTTSKEDVTKHKRQVTPGDHKRKLKPETIKKMTENMKDELSFFGYTS